MSDVGSNVKHHVKRTMLTANYEITSGMPEKGSHCRTRTSMTSLFGCFISTTS
jgi:hypothetical protein